MRSLVDSNVLVANFDESHIHHGPSYEFLEAIADDRIIISAHSLSEAFNKLTRGVPTIAFPATQVLAALRDLRLRCAVHALTVEQTLSAIAEFARTGGRGPRLYDFLIGQVAVLHGANCIVTWNVRDMAPLFPTLTVVAPSDFFGVV